MVVARAIPIVLMNSPIRSFCSANTCSTRARIFDFALLARRIVSGELAIRYISGGLKSWHRSNVARAARRVAVPIGRGTTKGRPILWRPVPRSGA